jgi:DNA-binding NarL/FixJ family response regulator
MSGIDAMIAIQAEFREARIIMMITFEGDGPVQHALQAGARSFILKNMLPREIAEVIRQVHSGNRRAPAEIASKMAERLGDERLTEPEIVLRQTAGGNRNRDIADKIFVAEETVKAYMKHMVRKLGANHRTQVVTIAGREGLIQL